jgi:hypothetical protein
VIDGYSMPLPVSMYPYSDLGLPPVLKELNLPTGKYLVAAKVVVIHGGTGNNAVVYCTLGTGPKVFWNDPADLLDMGLFAGSRASDNLVPPSTTIPMAAVLQLAQPGKVELRCSRLPDPLSGEMFPEFVQLTAIQVNEIVSQ